MSAEGRIRAAGYVRVSTEKQATEGLSLEAQEQAIKSAVESRGWRLAEVFVDAGVSGRRADRPALMALIARLAEFDRVVIWKLDRFGRSAQHMLRLLTALDQHGVRLISLSDGIDTGSEAGKMYPKILALFAEYEAGLLSERVRSVVETKARRGRPHGRAAFGYQIANGMLVPHPAEAPIVARIFAEYCGGASQNAITRGLIQDGVPPQRGEWYQGTISQMLSNPVYAGLVRLNGQTYTGLHPPIIDEDTWRRVELIRSGRRKWNGTGKGATPKAPHLFLHGILRCGECGGPMIPRSGKNRRSAPYQVYKCANRDRLGPDHCSQPPVRRALIDKLALDHLSHVEHDIVGHRQRFRDSILHMMNSVAQLRDDAERDATDAQTRFERVRRDYQDGLITADDWTDQRAALLAEIDAQRGYADQLQNRHQRLDLYLRTDAADELDRAVTAISQVVRGEARFDSPSLESARATITSLFASFTLHRHDDDYALTPRIRLEALWIPGSGAIRHAEETADLDLTHVLGEVEPPTRA